MIELLLVILILGILAGIVVFAVEGLTSSSGQASCGTDFKTVQTALEAYRAQMGNYPNGMGSASTPVTDVDPVPSPSLTVGPRRVERTPRPCC